LIVAKVTLINVSKVYRARNGEPLTAVDRLNLEISDRELVVLAGPPGSGKSSVLRMIAGLEEVSQGDITIGERRINDLSPQDRDVTMVFATDSLYPSMTARDNIAFALKRRGFAKAEIKKRVEDAANILSIGELLERKPRMLSFAQRQRTAIARALVRQPKVFLFDEALSNLDLSSRAELSREIRKLHERLQTTMIFAAADAREAMSLADSIVLLDGGVVQQIGPATVLYREPANMFVAKFLGHPPMNFVRGELRLDRASLRFCEEESGTIEIDLSGHERFDLRSFIGKPILLGIRPEDIVPAQSAAPKEGTSVANFRAIVEQIEIFGAEKSLHLSTGAHMVTCQSQAQIDQSQGGHRMEFLINLEKIHFFDPISGKRIV
jgi:multiple sugar transport system ATP-binding protein